jgi:hypothetical protein
MRLRSAFLSDFSKRGAARKKDLGFGTAACELASGISISITYQAFSA